MADPWHLKRGSTLPTAFRWLDRGGVVPLTGKTVLARLVDWTGTAIELSSEDGPVEIWEQADNTIGVFSVNPSLEQRAALRREAPGRYFFTAIDPDGERRPFADGPLIIEPGDGANG